MTYNFRKQRAIFKKLTASWLVKNFLEVKFATNWQHPTNVCKINQLNALPIFTCYNSQESFQFYIFLSVYYDKIVTM
jgi:hypothetical protein